MAAINKLDDGGYQVRLRDANGRQRRKRFVRKVDAQQWLDEQTAAIVRGDFVDPSAGRITFAEYAEQWRRLQLHHRPGTVTHVESRLRLHAYPLIGSRRLATIRRSDIQHLVAVASSRLAPTSVEVVYAIVAGVFNSAVHDRVISSSPCARINLPETTKGRVVPLTVDQVHHVADRVPERYRAMILVAAATGLRSGELRALTIDRITPPVHLRGDRLPDSIGLRIDRQLVDTVAREPVFGPPKTSAADRLVRVGSSTVQVLAEHLSRFGAGPGGVVFTTRYGGPVSRTTAGDTWRAAVVELDLGDRTGWHELRHFHASLLIADGRSVRAVADRLGHKDPTETLRTYAHLWPTDEERSVAAFELAIGNRA